MDYPLWSNEKMLDFFTQADGREFLQGISMLHQGKAADLYREFRFFAAHPCPSGSIMSKLRVALRKAVASIGVRKTLQIHCPGKTYTLHKGAAWWAITPALAHLIVKEWDENKHLKDYFKTSFCPAETFIQTVAFNSAHASRCMLAEGRYESLAALTPLTYINYHPVIKVLTAEDYDILQASGKMFCRKVVSGTSDELVRMLERNRRG